MSNRHLVAAPAHVAGCDLGPATVLVNYRTGGVHTLIGPSARWWAELAATGDTNTITTLDPPAGDVLLGQLRAAGLLTNTTWPRPWAPPCTAPPWQLIFGTREAPAAHTPPSWAPGSMVIVAGLALAVITVVQRLGPARTGLWRLLWLLDWASRRVVRPASPEKARQVVHAVRRVGLVFPGRAACLEESAAAALTLAALRLGVTWCHGVSADPIRPPRLDRVHRHWSGCRTAINPALHHPANHSRTFSRRRSTMSETTSDEPLLWLTGDKAGLGPYDPALVESYWRWENDPRVRVGYGQQTPESLQARTEGIGYQVKRTDSQARFTIYDLTGPQPVPVGTTALLIDHRVRLAEFFILIGSAAHRGQGIGTEATLLTLDYGFHVTNLRCIHLAVLAPNTPAIRAYENAGFRRIGQRRQSGYWLGATCDEILMDALPAEFPGPSHVKRELGAAP